MKNSFSFVIIAATINLFYCFSQQNNSTGWFNLFESSISIFKNKLAIPDLEEPYPVVNAELFAQQFTPESIGISNCTNTIKRVELNNVLTLSFKYTPAEVSSNLTVIVNILPTHEEASKIMFSQIVAKSMPPDKIAEGFTLLESEPNEIRMVETTFILQQEKKHEAKLFYWLYGNMFIFIYAESGIDESIQIFNLLRSIITNLV